MVLRKCLLQKKPFRLAFLLLFLRALRRLQPRDQARIKHKEKIQLRRSLVTGNKNILKTTGQEYIRECNDYVTSKRLKLASS